LPRGLYALSAPRDLHQDDVVTFPVPATVRSLVVERQYLRPGATLLKRVVAVAGDHVCLDGARFVVNGRQLATTLPADSRGRPLEPYRFCGQVPAGAVFVASSLPTSFDSRYFGPIATSSVTLARPLWTY
jgi:conjugative transfer signal peptidase TraF